MSDVWPSEVELSDYVRDLATYQMRCLVPPPVAVRVDQLVADLMRRVRDLGDVSHGELVAALIQTAAPDDLDAKVLAYRNARVHEALLDASATTGLHPIPAKKLGRPKRA